MLELKKYANCLVLAPKKPSAPSLKKIPAAVYSVVVTDDDDIVLTERVKQYTLPVKIYGISHKRNLRIAGQQYEERTARGLNTGMMITGFKGSGKTLLAEAVANEMIARDRPVFYINQQLSLETLTTLAKYASPCMFLFDEFEKVYAISGEDDVDADHKVQNKLLTFFSTTEFGGVLSALVSNDGLSRLLRHRPQRMLLNLYYGEDTRDRDFEVAMEELGFTPYLKMMMLLGDSSSSRNIDCLLTVANAVEKNYIPDDPTSGEEILELLEVMNVDLRIPWKYRIVVNEVTDASKLGLTISAKHCIVRHNAGVHMTITDAVGKVVFEKKEVFTQSSHVSIKGLSFAVLKGEQLPFNADLIQAEARLTLDETHLDLLSELGDDSTSIAEDAGTLVGSPSPKPILRMGTLYSDRLKISQPTQEFINLIK